MKIQFWWLPQVSDTSLLLYLKKRNMLHNMSSKPTTLKVIIKEDKYLNTILALQRKLLKQTY